jgi:hypothetical protein
MNIADQAFSELYPDKKNSKEMKIKYSKAFKAYNANVKYRHDYMEFKLSYEWKAISDDIKIGLIQHLLLKVYREKKKTINMDLYDNFLRNIGDFAKVTEVDPVLDESFNRVNEKYFQGLLDKPNLTWGEHSFAKLGSYAYGANIITISKVLEEDQELLDYVMYHEMLHKKHKYHTKDGRSYHHTAKFREKEREFENHDVEKKLQSFLRKKKFTHTLGFRKTVTKKEKKKKSLLEWFFE